MTAVVLVLATNQIAGLLSPCSGPSGDRWGYRPMMMSGISLASVWLLGVWMFPTYAVLLIGLFAVGVGISIYDPSMQAYIGAHLVFAQRGRAMGLVETAWRPDLW